MANMSKLKSDFFLIDLCSTVFPRIMRPPQHPLTAWLAAGFSTAVIAVVVFLAFAFTMDDFTGSLYKTFYVLVIFEAVHLLGHLIVGLPFFFIFWNRRDSLWRCLWIRHCAVFVEYIQMGEYISNFGTHVAALCERRSQ